MTPTLKTGLRFLGTSIGLLMLGMVFVHPINQFMANGPGGFRWHAFVVFTLFGLFTGLMAFAYLISAGIEIAGRFLWPRNPPDESELQ